MFVKTKPLFVSTTLPTKQICLRCTSTLGNGPCSMSVSSFAPLCTKYREMKKQSMLYQKGGYIAWLIWNSSRTNIPHFVEKMGWFQVISVPRYGKARCGGVNSWYWTVSPVQYFGPDRTDESGSVKKTPCPLTFPFLRILIAIPALVCRKSQKSNLNA